jgi:hypothetical protein
MNIAERCGASAPESQFSARLTATDGARLGMIPQAFVVGSGVGSIASMLVRWAAIEKVSSEPR